MVILSFLEYRLMGGRRMWISTMIGSIIFRISIDTYGGLAFSIAPDSSCNGIESNSYVFREQKPNQFMSYPIQKELIIVTSIPDRMLFRLNSSLFLTSILCNLNDSFESETISHSNCTLNFFLLIYCWYASQYYLLYSRKE